MAKKAKPQHGKRTDAKYVIGGPAPEKTDVPLSAAELASGNEALDCIVQQATTNTTQYAAVIAAADWLRGSYSQAETFLVSELCTELSISSATVNKYAGLAGVRTPARGQRDFRYSATERRQVYQHIAESSSDAGLVNKCRLLLENRK